MHTSRQRQTTVRLLLIKINKTILTGGGKLKYTIGKTNSDNQIKL